jgi:hypothetical protein
MAGFFAQIGTKATGEWKEEIVFFDPGKTPAAAAVFPDGTPAVIPAGRDPREVFAAWLTAPDNPWFARAVANRAWSWLLGRGIVEEPDDIRPDNPPSNPALLALLERELVAAQFDLRHLFRLILNSQAYQLACVPRSDRPEAAAHFAFYPLRRLDAEVLIDALNQITGTTESYSSAIPEPYTFIPADSRSIELADGSITSSFLEMFGRPARDTGLESERNSDPTNGQRLHLLNATEIRNMIGGSPLWDQLAKSAGKDKRELLRLVYMTLLSRAPTPEEEEAVAAYVGSGGVYSKEGLKDIAWALTNTKEFLYRH